MQNCFFSMLPTLNWNRCTWEKKICTQQTKTGSQPEVRLPSDKGGRKKEGILQDIAVLDNLLADTPASLLLSGQPPPGPYICCTTPLCREVHMSNYVIDSRRMLNKKDLLWKSLHYEKTTLVEKRPTEKSYSRLHRDFKLSSHQRDETSCSWSSVT